MTKVAAANKYWSKTKWFSSFLCVVFFFARSFFSLSQNILHEFTAETTQFILFTVIKWFIQPEIYVSSVSSHMELFFLFLVVDFFCVFAITHVYVMSSCWYAVFFCALQWLDDKRTALRLIADNLESDFVTTRCTAQKMWTLRIWLSFVALPGFILR